MKRKQLQLVLVVICGLLVANSPARLETLDDRSGVAAADAPVAKSVIFFIGDGMGPQIVSIAKIYAEESLGSELNMVILANQGTTGYMTTHSAKQLVTDSAASGTAMATGTKTANGIVGMTPDGVVLENLFEEAVREGKSVGVVTTTSVTDATPASFLAHVPARHHHYDIALQIVEGDAMVVMGGGYRYFLPPDRGKRWDGRDLTEEARGHGFDVVFDKQELEKADGTRLLGLFAPVEVPFERLRNEQEIPSLMDMTRRALDILAVDPDGFFLVVEGGRIDHAEHENSIRDAIGDLLAFDAAIGYGMEFQQTGASVSIIVSADHDCGGPAITGADSGYPVYETLGTLVGEDCEIVRWVSGHHTATMVPVFAKGPGAESFGGIQDNTELHDDIARLLGL
jgi:alkaline phosphatase